MILLRRALAGLLVWWVMLGAATTLSALAGPSVWWNESRARPPRVIGQPLRGALEVTTIGSLLDEAPERGADRWLVVFPAGSDEFVVLYIRYQLASHAYPRRVDVIAGAMPHDLTPFERVITAPGIDGPVGWRAARGRGGFTPFVRPAP